MYKRNDFHRQETVIHHQNKQTSTASHSCKDMKVFNLSPLVVVVAFATTILAASIPTPDCIAACNTAAKECLARKIEGQ
jgi:hypothetical protein